MVTLLGIPFSARTMNETIDTLIEVIDAPSPNTLYHVVTANPEMVMLAQKDATFHAILTHASMVTADGIGVVMGTKLLKQPLPERVTGFDTITNLLARRDQLGKKTRVFCLGATDDTIKLAVRNLRQQYEHIDIVGYHHGYFEADSAEEKAIIEQIQTTSPDVLLVGLGSPRQELFIDQHKEQLQAKVAIGCGGSFDVLSGRAKRAPIIIRKIGLEWLYRLGKQPSRIKRQAVLPLFIVKVMRAKTCKS